MADTSKAVTGEGNALRRILTVVQHITGQWQYKIVNGIGYVLVDWQYAGFSKQSAIAQARDRFGFDVISDESHPDEPEHGERNV